MAVGPSAALAGAAARCRAGRRNGAGLPEVQAEGTVVTSSSPRGIAWGHSDALGLQNQRARVQLY